MYSFSRAASGNLAELLFALPLGRDRVVRKPANRANLGGRERALEQCKTEDAEAEELYACAHYILRLMA